MENAIHRRVFLLEGAFRTAAALILLALTAQAQTTTTMTATDQVTPANLQAGSPEGSYDLSGFENVNLFNGNMNFALPLVHIGGRGSAGYTMTLALNTKTWHVRRSSMTTNNEETNITYTPTIQLWEAFPVGYGPGTLFGRRSGEGTQSPIISPCTAQHPLWEKTITRLTFTGPDGSEVELRDAATLEKPYTTVYADCQSPLGGFSRGQVFISSDASAMTFISDSNVNDINQVGNSVYYASGYLLMRDGTRYRIDSGLVSWIQDRNGNRVTFSYDANNRVSMIVDSLNRVVTILYDQSDQSDHINFIGFGGTQRTIRVVHSALDACLRTGFSTQTYGHLFPELNGSGNIQPSTFDPATMASAVVLPNARQYTINYDSYAEVAQVILPTGGIYEYDYTPTSGVANDNVTGVDFDVFRRVIARRTKPDGVNVETWTKYTPSSTSVIGDTITVDHMDSTGMTLIARETHTYPTEGIPIQYTGTDPTKFILYKNGMDGKETEVDHLDSNGSTILRTVVNAYQGSSLSWWNGGGAGPSYDVHLTDEYTTLLDTGTTNGHPNPGMKSRKHYEYDQYSNLTKTDEYDFGTDPSVGSLVRETTTTYLDSIGTSNYRTVNPSLTNPDPAQTIHIRNLPAEQDVSQGTTAVQAKTTYVYDGYPAQTAPLVDRTDISGHARNLPPTGYGTSYTTRGNATTVTRWLLPSTQLSTNMQYDIAGNVTKTTDPNGNATTLDYADVFGTPDGEARTNTAPAELSNQSQSSYAFVTKVTNAARQIGYTQYDYHIGKPVDGEDPNGVVASGFYNDSMDRPTQVIRGNQPHSTLIAQTGFSYDDAGRVITTTSDQTSNGDNILKSTLIYDGLGRTVETHKYETGGGFIVTSKKTFDALGRLLRTYNPYRATSDSTYGYASTAYDALSRVLTVTTFDLNDASTGVVQTSYSGNQVTVTDQAGKARRSITDALARLTKVIQDPSGLNYSTSYTYDALDDLLTVTQGAQTRTFVYDSLKRLTSASNPESGTVTYPSYDRNGNLLQKNDARNITTNYTYDALNRVTSRTYQHDTSGTPAVAYFYDAQALPNGAPTFSAGSSIGRLVAVTYGGGAAGTYQGYDTLGRPIVSYQQTLAQGVMQSYQMGYGYDLSGAMTSETYPSGKIVNMQYDAAGRVITVSKQGGGNYASAIAYAPHGAVASMTLGNGLLEQTTFNNRLQPTLIQLGVSMSSPQSLLGLAYAYNTMSHQDNNGNLLSQTINAGTTQIGSQNYTYDGVNRLQTATEGSAWNQIYDCDQFGNRAVRSSSQYIPNPTLTPQSANATDFSAFDQTTNQIKSTLGFQYDGAGNLTADPTAASMAYDAANHQTSYAKSTTTMYGYDGDGRRVTKTAVGSTTVFVYNITGQLIAEYGGSATNVGTSYLTADYLGSTRVATNSTGGAIARHDYLPFGEEIPAGIGANRTSGVGYVVTDDTTQRFTQKERDSESGLDYFGARYYSSPQGRFTSTDPVTVTPQRFHDAQRFNGYAYTRDNPLRFIDPRGEDVRLSGDLEEAKKQLKYILGTDDADKRVTFDAKTNTISVDLNGIDLSKNEGAALLNDMVSSKNVFEVTVGSTVQTLGGTLPLVPTAKGGDWMANLDNNPDYRYKKNPDKTTLQKPPAGVDDEIGLNLDYHRKNSQSITNLKQAPEYTTVFHELAEAYGKVEHNEQYEQAHKEAIDRENRLREQRPNLKEYNPGSGPGSSIKIKQ
jgi:RHS repeat-associated protein